MRIVILSQFFHPEPAKSANILAAKLAEKGHSVQVITGYPNRPEGKLYEGYRQRIGFTESFNGIPVRRFPIFISYNENPMGRAANLLSFSLSSLCASRYIRDADVVYVYATPMTAAVAAQAWKFLYRIPYVLHVQDLWPDSVVNSSLLSSRNGRHIGATLNKWLDTLYSQAEHLIAIAPLMARTLKERGVPKVKVSTVLNWSYTEPPPTSSVSESSKRFGVEDGSFVLGYAGNLGDYQDLETIIAAVRALPDLTTLRLVIAGSGPREEHFRSISKDDDRIIFAGRIPINEVSDLYAISDYQLVTLQDLPMFRATIPSKLQACLASGVPVITNVPGDVGEIVSGAGLGFVAEPGSSDSLACAIRSAFNAGEAIRRQQSQSASAYYHRKMSQTAGVDRIEQILLAARRRKPDADDNG